MDIQKWLDETALLEPPPTLPEQLGLAAFLRPKELKQTPRKKRRRKRSTSDSSLLDARPQRNKAPPIEHGADIDQSGDESACSDASHSIGSSSLECSTLTQQYARKPRRKTRPERYEPSSKDVKERGVHVHRRRRSELKKTRHKSKHKKAEKPGNGIVQSFHAKNVPRDRLTLRPREKLGIFNKGRASSPVKGRGLPDLVFSEMKFLQKHKDQPDVEPQPGPPKKRRKNHTHSKEEISAYFTSAVRPALAEEDVNIQAKEGPRNNGRVPDGDHRERERSSAVDNAIPTVEVPDKASYLGFGSRGPHHESVSYISWSKSIQAPSATSVRPRAGSTINIGQLNAEQGRRCGGNTDGGDILHSRPAPQSVTKHIADSSGERYDVSSLLLANHRLSRSHSLPQQTSSPRRVNLVDRAAKGRTFDAAASPSSMPPILSIRSDSKERKQPANKTRVAHTRIPHPSQNQRYDTSFRNETDNNTGEGRNNVEPQRSSSLGRILQECNTAFNELRQAASLNMAGDTREDPAHFSDRGNRGANSRPLAHVQRIPTVRFSEGCQHRVPNFTGPSIYEQQAHRQQLPDQVDTDENSIVEETYFMDNECMDEQDGVDYDDGGWDELQEAAIPYEMGADAVAEGLIESYGGEQGEESFGQANSVVSGGFWRPHRLY